MTSAEPSTSGPSGPSGPADTALSAALTNEHAVIYGYGIVSAHCAPEMNTLVSFALNQHRQRRDRVISMLAGGSVTAPVAAAGYQLPMPVNSATDAVRLAERMEKDTEVAWRAFIEQAQSSEGPRIRRDGADPERSTGRPMEADAGRLADHHGLPRRRLTASASRRWRS